MLRTVVWTDGHPAVGIEYGPGHSPVCCPVCDACVQMIIEAQRDGAVLGWMLFDDDGKCGHILDSGRYVMNVTGTWDAVTVAFETRKAQETGEVNEAETEDPRSDDQRSAHPRIRKAKRPDRQVPAVRPAASSDPEGLTKE